MSYLLLIAGFIGAGIMYFLDPEAGKRRRAQMRDQVEKMSSTASERFEKLSDTYGDKLDELGDQATERLEKFGSNASEKLEKLSGVATEQAGELAKTAAGKARRVAAATSRRLKTRRLEKLSATASEKLEKLSGVAAEQAGELAKTAADKALRVAVATSRRLKPEVVSDRTLASRIRSEIKRSVSHPHSIEIKVDAGVAVLSGNILSHEAQPFIKKVTSMPGVRAVEDHLKLHEDAGNMPDWQGS